MERKTGILGILIAVLILGIGYAAITRNLTVSGTGKITPSDDNFQVVFDESTTPSTTSTVPTATVSGSYDDELNAIISVAGLQKSGDVATVTYTILNNSTEYDANLLVGTITNSESQYFRVEASLGKATLTKKSGTADSTTLVVTVTAIKTPTEEVTTNITVPVTATAVE